MGEYLKILYLEPVGTAEFLVKIFWITAKDNEQKKPFS